MFLIFLLQLAVVHLVAWNEGDADQLVPSIFAKTRSRRGGDKTEDATSTTAAGADATATSGTVKP